MKLTKITGTGSKSSLTAVDSVFAAEVNDVLLAQAIRVYLSNARQGTSKVKTRGEIIRTKKKWYKQKGTGNARHGARSANIFVGGGVAHGPKGNENWKKDLTTKMKKAALVSALSAQATNIVVCDEVKKLQSKTKDAAALFGKLVPQANKILLVLDDARPEVVRAVRNIENILIVNPIRINALEVAMADTIVMTTDSVKALETRLSSDKKEVKKEVKADKKTKVEAKPVAKKAEKKAAPKKAAKPAVKKATTKKTTKTTKK